MSDIHEIDERELDGIAAVQSEGGQLPPPRKVGDAQVKAAHGACSIRWGAPLYITIDVDRFGEDRGELRAEVLVRYTAQGLERQLLAPRRVPLLGTRAHSELAKDLGARMRDVDWRELLEVAFTEAVKAYREGEPAILLSDVPQRLLSRYALEPLVLDDLLTVAWARPDQGKTWIASAVAAALHTGRGELLGVNVPRPKRVAILDWEDDEFTKADRVRAIAGEPVPDIVYVACRAAIWDELDRITRIIRQHEIEFLILDSVAPACGGLPPESSEAALRFGTAVRRLGMGVFATAHMPKDRAADESAPFGSIFWLAQLRLGWYVRREQDGAPGSGFTFGLFCKKSNNDRAPAPLAYDVVFEGKSATFRRRDLEDVPDLASKLPLRVRIHQALRTGPKSYLALANELGEDTETVQRTVRRYMDRDFTRIPERAGEPALIALLAHDGRAGS